jgi:DnaA-homolog protein
VLTFAPVTYLTMKQLLLELVPPAAPAFDNLVIGANAELIAAARAMAMGTSSERVLYVWGEPGAGKSHLCAAVLRQCSAAVRIAHTAVPSAPASAGLHVLDDVNSLDEDAQAALFNFFNQRGEASLFMTGSQASRDLPVRRDLSTRVGSGLTYQMKPLSDAEKQAALLAHAGSRGMALAEGIAGYLLRHGRRDMRSLIAMLDAIDRYSLEAGRPVTLPMVREALNQS